METKDKVEITVEAIVKAPVEKAWKYWTMPEHITKWNFASDDWHSPWAKNDLKVGGKFAARMEAIDGSFGFDFEGIYDEIIPNKKISYKLADDRKVKIIFSEMGMETKVTETFDAESENPAEMQKTGWQSIMDNFKKHVEGN